MDQRAGESVGGRSNDIFSFINNIALGSFQREKQENVLDRASVSSPDDLYLENLLRGTRM